ncbi:MAG: type IV pilus biogenesis protein PilM [Vicinamibacterales bacterium]
MSALARWLNSPPPNVGLEVSAERVTAVLLSYRGEPSVTACASEALPAGAIVPSLLSDNIVDRAAVGAAVARVLERVGKPKRLALIVPDAAAKVSIVRFETIPSRAADLDQLVRFQVKKAVPFPLEQAQVAYAPCADGGRELAVVVMRRDVVEGYEALVKQAGAVPGLVDLASFNIINLVQATDRRMGHSTASDWLLVHLTEQASTLAIVRGHDLVFYRNRIGDGQEPLVDLVHQTAMYYEDRLGGRGFGRVVLSAQADALALESKDVRATLEERLKGKVELVDPRRAAVMGARLVAGQEELVAMAASLGAVLREAA